MKFPAFIRVASLSGDPIIVFNRTSSGTSLSGIEGKLLETLASALNFRYEIVSPDDGQWGTMKADGNWSGIIGMVAKGEADMGLSYLAITENRNKVVDFSSPYYVIDRAFVTDQPGLLPKYAVFLYPFKLRVWLLATVAFVMFPLILRMLKPCLTCCSSRLLRMAIRKESVEKSMVSGTILVSLTFFLFIYSSVLLSFLLVPLREPGVRNFYELSDAVLEGKFKTFVPKGSVEIQLLLESQTLSLRKLGEIIVMNNWMYDSRKNSDPKAIIGNNAALMGPRLILQSKYGIPPFTRKFISEDSIAQYSTAIALKKNFFCKPQLDSAILRIVGGGLFQKFVDDRLFETRANILSGVSERSPGTALALEDMYGIFLLLLLSYVSSFVLLLGEILHKRYFRY
ncbi:lig_chan-Glu_bd domain-containing protein [Trichonephila inaurata madagascariensis]|uniref:Lig_chan-Glu_bd domain-containing protein n=1 Tax=Trichonephila inaurata madagascariensis TaxID=2747483 RepID=A0A8X6I8J4_9ARAC|nr:lig_chan-Glu_bd domain-containing protein [Trichonephila inaurata madagascariensis]